MTHKLAAYFVSEVLLEVATLGKCMLHHWGLAKKKKNKKKKPCCYWLNHVLIEVNT